MQIHLLDLLPMLSASISWTVASGCCQVRLRKSTAIYSILFFSFFARRVIVFKRNHSEERSASHLNHYFTSNYYYAGTTTTTLSAAPLQYLFPILTTGALSAVVLCPWLQVKYLPASAAATCTWEFLVASGLSPRSRFLLWALSEVEDLLSSPRQDCLLELAFCNPASAVWRSHILPPLPG